MSMPREPLSAMLSGGHHNSLGRTEEVVDVVLADHVLLEELFGCYFSDDELVRLRTSSCFKRISQQRIDWLVPHIDRFLTEIVDIQQASTQWTLAILYEALTEEMSAQQLAKAKDIVKHNLTTWDDWIVLNYSMQALTTWALDDPVLRSWLLPLLEERTDDSRKAVAGRAKKMLARLDT